MFEEGMLNLEHIELPSPQLDSPVSLEYVLQNRRSCRDFDTSKSVEAEKISQLLWSAQGITNNCKYRTTPSAGATYPLEIYVVLKQGLFYYVPEDHVLVKKNRRENGAELTKATFFQDFVGKVPVNVIFCAKFARTISRYGHRGERYVLIELGQAVQNLLLQAYAIGLAGVEVGAFDDKRVRHLLQLPEDHLPLIIVSIGYMKK